MNHDDEENSDPAENAELAASAASMGIDSGAELASRRTP
jgi:hypothetical protein